MSELNGKQELERLRGLAKTRRLDPEEYVPMRYLETLDLAPAPLTTTAIREVLHHAEAPVARICSELAEKDFIRKNEAGGWVLTGGHLDTSEAEGTAVHTAKGMLFVGKGLRLSNDVDTN